MNKIKPGLLAFMSSLVFSFFLYGVPRHGNLFSSFYQRSLLIPGILFFSFLFGIALSIASFLKREMKSDKMLAALALIILFSLVIYELLNFTPY